MPSYFTFNRGVVKLKEIESVVASTEYREGELWLMLSLKLRNGKMLFAGGSRLTNLDGHPEPQAQTLFLNLPSGSMWEKLGLGKITVDGLTLGVGLTGPTVGVRLSRKKGNRKT